MTRVSCLKALSSGWFFSARSCGRPFVPPGGRGSTVPGVVLSWSQRRLGLVSLQVGEGGDDLTSPGPLRRLRDRSSGFAGSPQPVRAGGGPRSRRQHRLQVNGWSSITAAEHQRPGIPDHPAGEHTGHAGRLAEPTIIEVLAVGLRVSSSAASHSPTRQAAISSASRACDRAASSLCPGQVRSGFWILVQSTASGLGQSPTHRFLSG